MAHEYIGLPTVTSDEVAQVSLIADLPTGEQAGAVRYVLQTSSIYAYDGTTWSAVWGLGAGSVDSVAGRTGVVVLTSTDVSEGTRLYYTDVRARAAIAALPLQLIVMNTATRNALTPSAGQVIYNSDAGVIQVYNGVSWV